MKAIDNTFQIKIEPDGTVTIVTGKMGKEIHQQAEEFLELIAKELNAETIKTPADRDRHNQHVHKHSHIRT